MEGRERMLPVSQDSLPQVARQFIALQQDQLLLAKVIEYTRPVLEEAQLEEQRTIEAVQVVDAATPPVKKARPRRSVIVIASTLSGFLLVVLYVLLFDWWRRNHAAFAHRLKAASEAPAPPHPPAETPTR
jgi:LPS O-antigen subunit length determinant protein (WzzB/FepE family)